MKPSDQRYFPVSTPIKRCEKMLNFVNDAGGKGSMIMELQGAKMKSGKIFALNSRVYKRGCSRNIAP